MFVPLCISVKLIIIIGGFIATFIARFEHCISLTFAEKLVDKAIVPLLRACSTLLLVGELF